jgi:lambda family phage portal protein
MFGKLFGGRRAAPGGAGAPARREPHVQKASPGRRSAAGGGAGFAAAAGGHLYADWVRQGKSTDAYLRQQLAVLVQRSRALARNNGFVRRYLSLVQNNVVGPFGIRLNNRALQRRGAKLDWKANTAIETAWLIQREKGNFTVDGRLTATDAEKLWTTMVERDGECFVQIMEGAPGRYRFGVRFIAPECLDYQLCRELPGGNRIYMGLEIEPVYDRVVAYWFLTKNPNGDAFEARERRYVRVPAENILHGFFADDIQLRGVPSYVSGMSELKMLDGYCEAELIAARVAASKMGFYRRTEKADPYSAPVGGFPDEGAEEGAGEGGGAYPGGPDLIDDMMPGTMHELPEGYEVQTFDPQHPNAAFDTFVKAALRGFASSTGAAGYHSVANDLNGVSYSGLRWGALDERDGWQGRQQHLIEHFARPIYRRWLRWVLATGQLPGLNIDDFDRLCAPVFRPRGWKWVDPKREAEANRIEMELQTTSRSAVCADKGVDFEDTLAELAAERELAERYKVPLSVVDAALTGAGAVPVPVPDDDPDKQEV